MRRLTETVLLDTFMRRLAEEPGAGDRVYFTGGATAVLLGWRPTTIDIDLKLEQEAERLLQAIPRLMEELMWSGALIGALTSKGAGDYSGQFTLAANPQKIAVKSDKGGSATREVTVKP